MLFYHSFAVRESILLLSLVIWDSRMVFKDSAAILSKPLSLRSHAKIPICIRKAAI